MERIVREIYKHLRENYSIEDLERVKIIKPFRGVSPVSKERYQRSQRGMEDIHHARLALALALAGEEFGPDSTIVAFDRLMENPLPHGDVVRALRNLHGIVGKEMLDQALAETDVMTEETITIAAKKLEQSKEILKKNKLVASSIRRIQEYLKEFWS